MFESRCGACCNQCERKWSVNCSGCLSMSVPFWGGQCKVKTCCESKTANHCGECTSFPCEMLSRMGKDQGFDPIKKINQCKDWAKEQKEAVADDEN